MLNFTTKKCYMFTISELEQSLSRFFQETYHYQPNLYAYFNSTLSFPVVIGIHQENDDSFLEFWSRLHHDIFRLKNTNTSDDDVEFGDKLLRLMLGQDIDYYFFDRKNDEKSTVIDDKVYIFTSLFSSLSFEENEEIVQKKISDFHQIISTFIFRENDFLSMQTEHVKITNLHNDMLVLEPNKETGKKTGCISLNFFYKKYKKSISFGIYTDYRNENKFHVTIVAYGIAITQEMKTIAHQFTTQLENLCQQKLSHLSPFFKTIAPIPYIDDLPISSFEGLSEIENKILTLRNLYHLEYEEILNHLNVIPTEISEERMEFAFGKYIEKVLEGTFVNYPKKE